MWEEQVSWNNLECSLLCVGCVGFAGSTVERQSPEVQFGRSRGMNRLEVEVWMSTHTAWKATRLDEITRKVERKGALQG